MRFSSATQYWRCNCTLAPVCASLHMMDNAAPSCTHCPNRRSVLPCSMECVVSVVLATQVHQTAGGCCQPAKEGSAKPPTATPCRPANVLWLAVEHPCQIGMLLAPNVGCEGRWGWLPDGTTPQHTSPFGVVVPATTPTVHHPPTHSRHQGPKECKNTAAVAQTRAKHNTCRLQYATTSHHAQAVYRLEAAPAGVNHSVLPNQDGSRAS